MKQFLIAVGIALVLFAFVPHDRPAPAPAPAPVAAPVLVAAPAPAPALEQEPAASTEDELGRQLDAFGVFLRGQLVGAAVLLAIVIALVVGLEKSRGAGGGGSYGRSMTIRTEPGHGTKDANVHEAGHWAAAEREGARVSLIKVNPDGSGLVRVHGVRSAEASVAIASAGAHAEGSWAYAGADRRNIEDTLRSVPRAQRAAVRAEGMRRGRAHASSARVAAYAKRIGRKGTIRPW